MLDINIVNAEALVTTSFIEDHLKSYSEDEKKLIQEDLQHIEELSFKNKQSAQPNPIYLGTAGAPASSKSYILEGYLASHQEYVYIDPDRVSLENMKKTYQQTVNKANESNSQSREQAYTKWRDASNYITYTILNKAFFKGYHIAHGTTSTSPKVESLYSSLNKHHYTINLFLCASPDENRLKANDHRMKIENRYQVSEKDFIEKGNMIFDNFPLFFKYANKIDLFWTQNFKEGSHKVAVYNKGKGLETIDAQKLNTLIAWYDNGRKNKSLPSLGELITIKNRLKP